MKSSLADPTSPSATRNTPQLWDKVWRDAPSAREHRNAVALEEHSVRWKGIETRVRRAFGRFEGLRVIEMGAGAGTNAALMAKRGASVTLLDYSPLALERASELFSAIGANARFCHADALSLPPELRGTFDVAMSFGLNEHFQGPERLRIFEAHLQALAEGGIAFVSVPNARNLPYRAFKWVAQATGHWKLGVEIPFTRAELRAVCAALGVQDCECFGDSFLASWQLVNPLRYLRKRWPAPRADNVGHIPWQRATPLDDRWGYALVLVMRKPAARAAEGR